MKKVIIAALMLRFFFASFFYHPDIKSQYFHASYLSAGIINIYDFIHDNKQRLPYTDTFNYPPLTYFILGAWYPVAQLVAGSGLHNWLIDWGPNSLSYQNLFLYLFILKLPYLFADFMVLKLLIKLFPDNNKISQYWLFNPVSIYAIYMIGQFDILPVLLTVGAFYYAKKERILISALLLGLGGCMKTYPLLILPFILIRSQNIKTFFSSAFISLAAYVFPMLIFINSSPFVDSVFKSSLANSLFMVKIFQVPVFFIYYLAVFVYSLSRRKNFDLLAEFLAITISPLIFSRFHPQWGLWSLPFLIILLIKKPKTWPILIVIMFYYFGFCFLIPDSYMLISLFAPLNFQVTTIPPISSFIPAL